MRVSSNNIFSKIINDFSVYSFSSADEFYFDAACDTIYFESSSINSARGLVCLLHEIAHAELAHFDYRTDLELFAMESRAWIKTKDLAHLYDLPCSDRFIQSCLSSYGRWVEARSTCPTCTNFSLQTDKTTYHCFYCKTKWHIAEDTQASIRRIKIDE
jgi:hypothetical protein